jgi:hypothetical protein
LSGSEPLISAALPEPASSAKLSQRRSGAGQKGNPVIPLQNIAAKTPSGKGGHEFTAG